MLDLTLGNNIKMRGLSRNTYFKRYSDGQKEGLGGHRPTWNLLTLRQIKGDLYSCIGSK